MWFSPVLSLAFVVAASAFSFDDSLLNAFQPSRQKRWSFNDYCTNDTNLCTDPVSTKCCGDDSMCQKGTDAALKCSSINVGLTTCAGLPMIAKCNYAGYDKNTPPAAAMTGGQTVVNLQVTLKHIYKYPDNSGLYNLDFYLVQYWNDTRLAHNENRALIFRYNEQIASIWRPDIFISNAITAYRNDVPEAPRSLRIYQDGLIRLSQRIQATVPCTPGLGCVVAFESYGNIVEVMKFVWIDQQATDAVKVDPELIVSNTVKQGKPTFSPPAAYNGRSYSCLKASFTFV